MKRAALGVVLAACTASGTNDFPPGGGGTIPMGGGSGGGGDAGVGDGGSGDGGAGVSISGRACLVTDLQLTTCAATGAGGLKVTLGVTGAQNPASATTAANGAFVIAAPLGAGFTWHVTSAAIATSVMPFGTDNTIPVISDENYIVQLESVGLLMQDEQHGSIVVRVVRGVTPVADVTATLNPLADSDTFYDSVRDSTVPPVWNTVGTKNGGVVWVPSVPLPGPVSVTLSQPDGTATTTSVPVESQAITFVTQGIP